MMQQLFLSALLCSSVGSNLYSHEEVSPSKKSHFSENCVFCKIIAGTIPCKKVYETEDVLVIHDISPKAPVHCLIIPKKHIANIQSATSEDRELLGTLLLTAQKLSTEFFDGVEFKLISNNGSSVGQTVFHIHIHFLSGSSNFMQQSAI